MVPNPIFERKARQTIKKERTTIEIDEKQIFFFEFIQNVNCGQSIGERSIEKSKKNNTKTIQ